MNFSAPPAKRPGFPGADGVTRSLPAIFAFFYFGYLALLPAITSRWLDFPVYWEAGKKALAGASVYDVAGHFQYKYSPLVALLFGKLFANVAFETASFVFQKIMLFFWVAIFLRFAKRDYRVVLVALLFFGNALRLDLELGQINAFVLYLLAMLFAALERPRRWAEDLPFAAVFSLAIQLKLFALVIVPLLVFTREWRKLFFGLLLVPLMSVGLVAVESGWEFAVAENRAWLASLFDSTDALLVSDQNVGVLGVFAKFFGPGAAKAIWVLGGALFTVFLWRNRDRTVVWFRDWLLFAIALFNPLVWSYWILYALPLFSSRQIDFEGAFRRRSRPTRTFGLAAAFFTFAAFNGQHARWAWNGGILAGLLLLGIVASRVRAGRA